MTQSRPSTVALLLISLYAVPAIATPQKSLPGSKPVADEETATLVVTYQRDSIQAQNLNGKAPFERIQIAAEDAEGYAASLRQQPGVARVERDYITRHPRAAQVPLASTTASGVTAQSLDGVPNDPYFYDQKSWQAPSQPYQGVHDILAAHALSEQNTRLRIGVLDSGFFPIDDIAYAGGYSFISDNGTPEYLVPDVGNNCTSPHGTAVTAVLGATTDNGIGIAGILDADLYAVRALNCDTGALTDLALGIRWLAGDTVLNAPVLQEPVHIINASVGADTEGACPTYLQEAIDFAFNQGILIVTSAGNEGEDASKYSPANCRNVIAAGAVERSGRLWTESNYGDSVDVLALGYLVQSINQDGEVNPWIGTSFASPIVAGIAGLLSQHNPAFKPTELAIALKQSVRSEVAPDSARQGQGGIIDALTLLTQWRSGTDSLVPDFYPVLDSPERCHRDAYTRTAPGGQDLTSLYEVHVTLHDDIDDDLMHTVFRSPVSGGEKEVLEATEEHRFLVSGVDTSQYRYSFNLCNAEGESCKLGEDIALEERISPLSASCGTH